MKIPRSRMASALVLVAVATLAACDDDDESLSEVEFRDQANAICITGNEEIGAVVGATFGRTDPSTQQLQEAVTTIVTVSRRQADKVDALAAPSSLSEQVAAMVAAVRTGADAAETQGPQFFASEDDPFAPAQQQAAELGLDACAGSS